MKSFFKTTISIAFIFGSMLFVSCKDDSVDQWETWKKQNADYLTSLKDSVGFVKDTAVFSNGYQFEYYYRIDKQADTAKVSPKLNSVVEVGYTGNLINGTTFDSSSSSTFPVNYLISGWIFNLLQMKTGEIRTIVIPHQLAYGSAGMSPSIPPYSTLRFQIRLIKIQ